MTAIRTRPWLPPRPAAIPSGSPGGVHRATAAAMVCLGCLLVAVVVTVAHPGIATVATAALTGVETILALLAWANHREDPTGLTRWARVGFLLPAPTLVAFFAVFLTVTTMGTGQSVVWSMVVFYVTLVAAAAAQLAAEPEPFWSLTTSREEHLMGENDLVRLTVFRLGPDDTMPASGAVPVVTDEQMVSRVDMPMSELVAAAGSVVWESVPAGRMGQLLTALETAFTTVPASGFAAVVNVPTRLVFVAVWPWALGAGRLAPGAGPS